jgi:LysM repeat protein
MSDVKFQAVGDNKRAPSVAGLVITSGDSLYLVSINFATGESALMVDNGSSNYTLHIAKAF